MKKYIAYSGTVYSADEDIHYVTANEIMRLYNVEPSECIAIRTRHDRLNKLKGLDTSKMVKLFPRHDGKYKLD